MKCNSKFIGLYTVVFVSILLTASNVFCAEKGAPKMPKSIKSLDGEWTWDWGKGKTAFILKGGDVRDLDIEFKLKDGLLKARFWKKNSIDLTLQPDGSWEGIEYPSETKIIMKRVDVKKLKIPKSIDDLDGKWIWDWGTGVEAFDLGHGKREDNRDIKFKLRGHILRETLDSDRHVDLILQPDGSWIGIEVPSTLTIKISRAKTK